MDRRPTSAVSPDPTIVRVTGLDEADRLAFGDLSDFFNPFLDQFVREAFRGGGEIWVSKEGSVVQGLLVYDLIEKVGSIFTRDRSVAEALFGLEDHLALFTDFPLSPRTEIYRIYGMDLPRELVPHRFAHSVRLARPDDHPVIVQMMRERYGRVNTSWLEAFPRDGGQRCFVAGVADEIAGVGWVSVANGRGRLHSLSVRPRYRRMRIGTDLWHARRLWAEHVGARQLISEISEQNVASLAIATAGGMHPMGQVLLCYRSESGGPGPSQASGAPQLGQALSVTSIRVPQ